MAAGPKPLIQGDPTMPDTKILLPESEIPRSWYNVLADAPTQPQPVLHPGTGQPIGPDDLAPLFPMDLILQEVSTEREIADPGRGHRRAAAVATHAAASRASAGARHRHAVAHLLQERERLARRVAQAQHRRCRRPTTTPRRGGRGSRPRPAPASGAARWRWHRSCSGWSARCTWCGSHTTRSRTGG